MPRFHRNAEGSCLYRAGGTAVLCTASLDNSVPDHLLGTQQGWLTAEYQMHPRSSSQRRENRDVRGRPPSGRTQEIQRLIGRSLRSALLLEKLGSRTIYIDCDVLEADGGTRTASVTGGFIAMAMALEVLRARGDLRHPVLRSPVAAVSVGHVHGELCLDLDYSEDSKARVDLNVVATHGGALIEVQGTAEGEPLPRAQLTPMLDLALRGIQELCQRQVQVLRSAGVSLDSLLIPSARAGS